MSEIHVQQIRGFLEKSLTSVIDMTDYANRQQAEKENAFLSRALVGFAISHHCKIPLTEVGPFVTDGFDDNGLDGIGYDKDEKKLFLFQSKWSSDGNSTIERGDTQKFLKGVRDLFTPSFDRFNAKLRAHEPLITSCLSDSETRFYLVVTYSSSSNIATVISDDIQDELTRLNDTSEVVFFDLFKQQGIYSAISKGAKGDPVNIDVNLFEWGFIREPHQAYYGQIAADDIANWWTEHYPKICAPNIRMFLGRTEVNEGIIKTISSSPENLWYFNNGITVLCDSIQKKMLGGNSRDTAILECRNLTIVNGAQTAGAISEAKKKFPEQVTKSRVPIRLISLQSSPETFGKEITRTNNTQNQIETRDFIALDSEQERIANELLLEGVYYVFKSGDKPPTGSVGFDFQTAIVARACAQNDVALTTLAKREISRLWEDSTKAPYKRLFNGSVSGTRLWKEVQMLLQVERKLKDLQRGVSGRRKLYAIHGNRFIAQIVFQKEKALIECPDKTLSQASLEQISSTTQIALDNTERIGDQKYPDSYLAILFKNQEKCKNIFEEAKII